MSWSHPPPPLQNQSLSQSQRPNEDSAKRLNEVAKREAKLADREDEVMSRELSLEDREVKLAAREDQVCGCVDYWTCFISVSSLSN